MGKKGRYNKVVGRIGRRSVDKVTAAIAAGTLIVLLVTVVVNVMLYFGDTDTQVALCEARIGAIETAVHELQSK